MTRPQAQPNRRARPASPRAAALRFGLALALASALAAPPAAPAQPQPDFLLPDLNPASPRAGALVSPRDYLGRVSVWYFGHET